MGERSVTSERRDGFSGGGREREKKSMKGLGKILKRSM